MSDNSTELLRKRKKERALLRQRTIYEAEMNPHTSASPSDMQPDRDLDPSSVTGQGLFGRKYRSENLSDLERSVRY